MGLVSEMQPHRESRNTDQFKKKASASYAQNPMRASRSVGSDVSGYENTGWQRMESRSEPGKFYYRHGESGKSMLEPPAPWEKIESKSRPGEWYYFNWRNGQTSWIKPNIEGLDSPQRKPVVPALNLPASDADTLAQPPNRQAGEPRLKKGMRKARSQGALEEPKKDKDRGKLCHHHKAHLLGGIVARDDTPRHAPENKKIDHDIAQRSRFPTGLEFVPKETPRDYEYFKQRRMYPDQALNGESMKGHTIVRMHDGKREERRANVKDGYEPTLRGATFANDVSPKARRIKKSTEYHEARPCLIGATWDPNAPDETPRRAPHKQLGVEEEAEPHLHGGVLVRSPQGPFKTPFDEFLALGPEDRTSVTTPRDLPRAAQSHLWGAHVICDDKYLRKDPQKQFFHDATRANIKGAAAIMVDPQPAVGIRTYAPRPNRIEGSGVVAVGEAEQRLIARFMPSTQKAKQLDPGEPRWVSLHRRRHFSEANEWVGDHLHGSGAHVTSEPEERLLYCGGGSRDVKCTARKWFPDFDHLSGAGVDQVHELTPRAKDLPQHDESEHHRKWFPDGDHMRGAGVDTILDLTPRDKGKRCDRNQLMNEEWNWWEFKEFAEESSDSNSPTQQATPRSNATFQSARTPTRSENRPRTPPHSRRMSRKDAPPSDSGTLPQRSDAGWSTPRSELQPGETLPRRSNVAWSTPRSESEQGIRRPSRRSDLASSISYEGSRATPRSEATQRSAWGSPRSASTPGSRMSNWLDEI